MWDRTVTGYNIERGARFSDVVDHGAQTVLLVFLRHYG